MKPKTSPKDKKNTGKINTEAIELYNALLAIKNVNEMKLFLRDLLTTKEIIELGRRWQAAKMLYKKMPYTKIVDITGLSSTTVARISKWLREGRGYKMVLSKRRKNEKRQELN